MSMMQKHDNIKKELGGNRTKMMGETDDEVCGTFHKNEQQTYIPFKKLWGLEYCSICS